MSITVPARLLPEIHLKVGDTFFINPNVHAEYGTIGEVVDGPIDCFLDSGMLVYLIKLAPPTTSVFAKFPPIYESGKSFDYVTIHV